MPPEGEPNRACEFHEVDKTADDSLPIFSSTLVNRIDLETQTEIWLGVFTFLAFFWGIITLIPPKKPAAALLPPEWRIPVALAWLTLGVILFLVTRRLDDQLDIDPQSHEMRTVRLFAGRQRTLSAVPFSEFQAVARRRTAPGKSSVGGEPCAGVTLLTRRGKTLQLVCPAEEEQVARELSVLLDVPLIDKPGLLTDNPVLKHGSWQFGQIASAGKPIDEDLPQRIR